MQITSYSKFRSNLKSYIDDCVSNDEPIIISRNDDSVVLLPLKKYKDLDETDFLKTNKQYANHVLSTFNKMKLKSSKILGSDSFKKNTK